MKTLETNKIRIPISNEKTISLLKNPKLMMAALFGTGGAVGFVSAKGVDTYETEALVEPVDVEAEDLDFAEITTDQSILAVDPSHSFSEAFAHSREQLGPGGIFEYKGELYNTYYKEEWDGMEIPQKESYFANFQDNLQGNVNHIAHNDQVTKISIDHDSAPEITLVDHNGDGLIDEIELTNDANVNITDASNKSTLVSSDQNTSSAADNATDNSTDPFSDFEDDFLDMSDGDFNLDAIVPDLEEVIVTPDDNHHVDLLNGDLSDIGVDDIVSAADGDLENVVELVEGDLGDVVKENVIELDEGDLSDPSDIETYLEDYFEEGDLEDPTDATDNPDLSNLEEPMNGDEWNF